MTPMIEKMRVNGEKTRANADLGYANATDLADYLAKKGMPFREAHHVVGAMVNYGIKHGKRLDDFSMEEYKQFSDKIEEDIRHEISLETCVRARKSYGGARRPTWSPCSSSAPTRCLKPKAASSGSDPL